MDSYSTPPVVPSFGSTPGMVFSRSGMDTPDIRFPELDGAVSLRRLFELSWSATDGWIVGPGWVYCGLEKVDLEIPNDRAGVSVGLNPVNVYLHVYEDDGEFSIEVSDDEDEGALVSVVLYKFENGKAPIDGRDAMFIPLYN